MAQRVDPHGFCDTPQTTPRLQPKLAPGMRLRKNHAADSDRGRKNRRGRGRCRGKKSPLQHHPKEYPQKRERD